MIRIVVALCVGLTALPSWAEDPLDALLAACMTGEGTAATRIDRIAAAGWVGAEDTPDTRAGLALQTAMRFVTPDTKIRAADVERYQRIMQTAVQIVPAPGVAPKVGDLPDWPPLADTPRVLLANPDAGGVVELAFKYSGKNADTGVLDCTISLFAPLDSNRITRLQTEIGPLELSDSAAAGDDSPVSSAFARRKAKGTSAGLMLQIVEINPAAVLNATFTAAGITTPLNVAINAAVGPINRN